MRISDIDPALAAGIAEPMAEDRWSEVRAKKPVPPKRTPGAVEKARLERKLARKRTQTP